MKRTSPGWPAPWRGAYFAGDYGTHWIVAVTLDAANQASDVRTFATDAAGPVSFAVDPTNGDLAYVAIMTGQVVRIRFGDGTPPPPGPGDGAGIARRKFLSR